MELFKTTGILDKPILKEVAKMGIPKSEKRAPFIYFGICILLCIVRYTAIAAIFFTLGLFLIIWQYVIFRRITINQNLRTMQEFNGVLGYQFTSWFDEDGIAVFNLTNHGEGKFRYAFLKRVFETEHILAVQTKKKQFVPIFKEGLAPEEIEELIAFLKVRNNKIKIDRLK